MSGVALLRATLAAALLAAASGSVRAADDRVTPFLGSYVGTAEVTDASGAVLEKRDMDIEISAGDEDSFTITWVNVTLVDGRRDVPGVDRRVQSVTLSPGEIDGTYVEETRGSLFERRRSVSLVDGDPLRWAEIHGNDLGIYSLVLLEDGSYELQRYDRILTDIGIDISYDRIVEGTVVRHITGHTVKVGQQAAAPASEE